MAKDRRQEIKEKILAEVNKAKDGLIVSEISKKTKLNIMTVGKYVALLSAEDKLIIIQDSDDKRKKIVKVV